VLLISIDTLRADRVGVYGGAEGVTPTLDRLAQSGARFATVIAAAPLTLPSHATMLTGLLPPRHGARHNGIHRLDSSVVTLAEVLHEEGFATAAVVSAAVMARRYGLDQGFETYDEPTSTAERRAGEVNSVALEWLSTRPRDRPFFLFLHYYDPHALYDPPPAWAQRFPGRPYDAEIAYTDDAIAQILGELDREGVAEQTLVVVTSDHGESFGQHDEDTHGLTLHDGVLRVPLMLRGPGIPAGRVVTGEVSNVSVAPTVLGALGVDGLDDPDGIDLSSTWREAKAPEQTVYMEAVGPEVLYGWSPLFGARTNRYFYVRAPQPALYELGSDSDQEHNLLTEPAAHTPEIESTRRQLDDFVSAVLDRAREPSRIALKGETVERLRALGYDIGEGPIEQGTEIDPKRALRWLRRFKAAGGGERPTTDAYGRATGTIRRYVILGQHDQAEDATQALLREHPGDAAAVQAAAEAWAIAKGFERSTELSRQALQIEPELADAHLSLGFQALRAGRDGEATKHFAAAGASAGAPSVQMELARVYAWRGKPDRAAAIWERLLEMDPATAARGSTGD
jgi:arylsulfatase A-like enzyme